MKLTCHRFRLPLVHEFTIARGSITHQNSLIVELELDGVSGFGEVTENTYYGHTFESLERSLSAAESVLPQYVDKRPEEVWESARAAMDNDMFALSALDMAAHDLFGKRNQLPTWKAWGLNWEGVPESSFTIGIDSIEKMLAKLVEQQGWGIYKIKLGTESDIEIVRSLREEKDATFRVDANCGWTPTEAVENSKHLASLGVEFIEQPLPAEASVGDKKFVYENSALPIIGDESCQTEADVEKCHGLFHGVNVKICKCGGLTPALRMLRRARELGMKTMVGCMVESSIGISGAAQLLPLLDYADLDGANLISDEPGLGVRVERGRVVLSEISGNGARLR